MGWSDPLANAAELGGRIEALAFLAESPRTVSNLDFAGILEEGKVRTLIREFRLDKCSVPTDE